MSWQTDWKVDKGIEVPEVVTHKHVGKRYDFLKAMVIGDSFVVRPHPEDTSNNVCQIYVASGKKLGMKMVTRKMYSKDDPKVYYFRLWYTEKIEPISDAQRKHGKKYKSQRREDLKPYENHDFKDVEIGHANFNDLAAGRLPNDILFLAEQNEENKSIVEDIRRLNKILIEELTKQNITLPKGE